MIAILAAALLLAVAIGTVATRLIMRDTGPRALALAVASALASASGSPPARSSCP